MTKLSDTQALILTAAAQHEARLAAAPKTLPAAARNAVFRSLLKNNLLTEINAPREYVGLAWRQDEEGTPVVLRITDEGMRAIGVDPNVGDVVADTASSVAPTAKPAPQDAPAVEATQGAALAEDLALLEEALATPLPKPRVTLRDAAQRVILAWDDEANQRTDLGTAIDALRVLLAGKPARAPRDATVPRKLREGTKQERVLAMLRREEGTTIAQIAEVTGWQQHTVRGFFAGLKKRQGIEVQVLERIRQVGSNREGARGSFTIYRIVAK